MLTREQLIDYIDNGELHLTEYQKTILWELYKKRITTDKDLVFTYGRCNGKTLFMYKIMKRLLECEASLKEND